MESKVSIGIRIPSCSDVHAVGALAVQAEAFGFDQVWVPDSQLLWRDVWVTLGAVAAKAPSLAVGTSVTNPVSRHVTVTASAASTLAEATGGRFTLGIGVGDSSMSVVGLPPATRAQLRDYVAQLRALWAGDWLVAGKKRARLRHVPRAPVPVFVGASGPRMLELAGEIADGVILHTGVGEETLRTALASIARGAERGGRTLEDLELATVLYCHLGADLHHGMKRAQPHALRFLLRNRSQLAAQGVHVPDPPDLSGIYPDLHHAEDWDHAIRSTDWIPDEALRRFCAEYCLIGTPADVAARIERLRAAGLSRLHIRAMTSYDLPGELCRSFGEEVIPRL